MIQAMSRWCLAIAACTLFVGSQAQAAATFPVFSCDLTDAGITLDPSQEVTITLTASERELLNLAIPGYIADLEKEFEGASAGGFEGRAFGLGVFAYTTVPCIRDLINAAGLGETDSVTVTLNSFERVAVQIMTSIWNPRDGVMSHHIAGCRRSRELRQESAILCRTFFPLAEAAESLFRKVSRDQ